MPAVGICNAVAAPGMMVPVASAGKPISWLPWLLMMKPALSTLNWPLRE